MIQTKQRADEVTFVIPQIPQKTAVKILPKIAWEVPPPDFEIPDDHIDNSKYSLT